MRIGNMQAFYDWPTLIGQISISEILENPEIKFSLLMEFNCIFLTILGNFSMNVKYFFRKKVLKLE